jgi:ERCC4-type nuclease
LASKLTGYNILLTKLGDEDIELTEFLPDMGKELYDLVFDTGIETAREFLEANTDFLLTIPGMTKEKLVELRQIMLVEFDEHEQPDILEAIKNFKPNNDIILD